MNEVPHYLQNSAYTNCIHSTQSLLLLLYNMIGSVRVASTSSEKDDFTHSTWVSLVGLIHVSELFIPVDQRTLWRKHVAWAANDGQDLLKYHTQRFSSSMVFLSLLLGTTLSMLANSATHVQEYRRALALEQVYTLKFYVGLFLTLDAVVSVIGLISTFTAWGMISAISNANARALLRSSMGQYVTSLPSRFVVASLYLFLAWLLLMLMDIMSGSVRFVVISFTVALFIQTIVSLSAFGRLIIHTGAMGQRRVLSENLERQLLPSGLHSSLLIKANKGVQRRTSVISQYNNNSTTPRSAVTPQIPSSGKFGAIVKVPNMLPHVERCRSDSTGYTEAVTVNTTSRSNDSDEDDASLCVEDIEQLNETAHAFDEAVPGYGSTSNNNNNNNRNNSRIAIVKNAKKPTLQELEEDANVRLAYLNDEAEDFCLEELDDSKLMSSIHLLNKSKQLTSLRNLLSAFQSKEIVELYDNHNDITARNTLDNSAEQKSKFHRASERSLALYPVDEENRSTRVSFENNSDCNLSDAFASAESPLLITPKRF